MPTQAQRKRIILSGLEMAAREFRLRHGLLSTRPLPRSLECDFSPFEPPHQHKSHKHILPSVFALGVRASERLAEIDMPYLLRYQPVIHTVGQKYCVDPAVIAGVLSRESHGSNAMVNVGNTGNGIGVVQDPGFYAPTSWISESQVSQITEVLTVRIKEIQRRFPTWTSDQHLKGGLCAYAGGPGYIRSSQDLSCDFCNDVLARAKYFKRHGF
uniref:Lysozyme g-like protein n=1 Tax=Canis lupus familiaris TaxID=9615 RepID=A0A8C0SQI5_CANLF